VQPGVIGRHQAEYQKQDPDNPHHGINKGTILGVRVKKNKQGYKAGFIGLIGRIGYKVTIVKECEDSTN
jgi:hypothetical protein